MKILLTSAGLKTGDIIMELANLCGRPLSELNVLFVTTAANTGCDDKRWLLENLNEFAGVGVAALDIIDVAGLPREILLQHFERADIICVGGGDEFYLARIFKESGISSSFPKWLQSKVYMGISAGSMVMGHLLSGELISQIFPEEDFGSEESAGLEILPFSYIPHLNSQYFSLRKERLEQMKDRFTIPLYATDGETAVSVNNGVVKIIGNDPSGWVHYGGQSGI